MDHAIGEGFLSGEVLGKELGISRAAVGKHLAALRAEGFDIESVKSHGHRLRSLPRTLQPSYLRVLLDAPVHFYEDEGSTNSVLKALALEGAPEGTVAAARIQSGGRGRMGREWVGPKGGLWFSVLLRPKRDTEHISLIPLIAGISVAEALCSYCDARLKWPNDVLVDGKKVCGILVELDAEMGAVNSVVVGIGVNLNFPLTELPGDLLNKATTVKDEVGAEVDENQVLRDIYRNVMDYYDMMQSGQTTIVLAKWKGLSDTLTRKVRVETSSGTIEGMAVAIDADGALLIRTDTGNERVLAGDCIHLR